MSTIEFVNNPGKADSDILNVASGDDIDYESSQEDAFIEFSTFDAEGNYTPMCPYGYTLNLEEAIILRDFLADAIVEAQHG